MATYTCAANAINLVNPLIVFVLSSCKVQQSPPQELGDKEGWD